jgi:hypothetical protein
MPSGYSIKAYSTNGGTKWRNVAGKPFDNAMLQKLLNKNLTLHLSDKPINKKTKEPAEDAEVITFAGINKRPKAPKLTVNYAIRADETGETPGQWVLTEKGGTDAVRAEIQIGAADSKRKNRVTDRRHFGHFYSVNGICVKELEGEKPEKTAYLLRTAPVQDDETYTAASKPRKVTALSESKVTKYKVKLTKASKTRPAAAAIRIRANTYTSMAEETAYHDAKDAVDVLEYKGSIKLWTGATAKRPASKHQVITR